MDLVTKILWFMWMSLQRKDMEHLTSAAASLSFTPKHRIEAKQTVYGNDATHLVSVRISLVWFMYYAICVIQITYVKFYLFPILRFRRTFLHIIFLLFPSFLESCESRRPLTQILKELNLYVFYVIRFTIMRWLGFCWKIPLPYFGKKIYPLNLLLQFISSSCSDKYSLVVTSCNFLIILDWLEHETPMRHISNMFWKSQQSNRPCCGENIPWKQKKIGGN